MPVSAPLIMIFALVAKPAASAVSRSDTTATWPGSITSASTLAVTAIFGLLQVTVTEPSAATNRIAAATLLFERTAAATSDKALASTAACVTIFIALYSTLPIVRWQPGQITPKLAPSASGSHSQGTVTPQSS